MPGTNNSVITSAPVAKLAVELLARSLVLPLTVLRIAREEYAGSGGTVSVRVRTPRLAREQTTPGDTIDYDALQEHSVPVAVTHLYDAALLADEDLTLSIVEFGRQVLEPQIASVATGAENELAAQMNAIEPTIEVDGGDAVAAVLQARQELTENNVPAGRRWLACSPAFTTALLDADSVLTPVDSSGSSSALREATIGKLYGFNVIESNAIITGSAVAYHESAFAAAFLAPTKPRGAVASTTHNVEGVALRHIHQYVPDRLADASVVSCFAGAGTITEDGHTPGTDLQRAVAISLPISSD